VQEAQRLYRESLGIEREVGDRPGEARTLAQLALLAEDQGDLPLALQRMEKAAAMFEEMGLAERGKAKEDLERLRRRLAGEPE
jgi:tetratricopeptide (TPR) repeat protein